jgi:DNA-binding XRE family transcriptional regulator
VSSITLTARQKQTIADAKSSGKRRIVMELTAEQSKAMKRVETEVEAEKDDIIRKARQAFAEQKTFETELAKTAQMLAAARAERGMSLSALAEITGMTRQALSRIERGENRNPTISTLHRIAAALGKEVVIKLCDVA